jgi:hypothetical protein
MVCTGASYELLLAAPLVSVCVCLRIWRVVTCLRAAQQNRLWRHHAARPLFFAFFAYLRRRAARIKSLALLALARIKRIAIDKTCSHLQKQRVSWYAGCVARKNIGDRRLVIDEYGTLVPDRRAGNRERRWW